MHLPRQHPAHRTGHRNIPGSGDDPDHPAIIRHILDDQRRKPRKDYCYTGVDIAHTTSTTPATHRHHRLRNRAVLCTHPYDAVLEATETLLGYSALVAAGLAHKVDISLSSVRDLQRKLARGPGCPGPGDWTAILHGAGPAHGHRGGALGPVAATRSAAPLRDRDCGPGGLDRRLRAGRRGRRGPDGGRAPDPHRNAGGCRPTTAPTEPDGSAACPGMGSVRTRSCVDRQLREVVSLTQGSANRSISTKAK